MHNKNAKGEIDVQKRLKHPNIIRLLDYYYDKQKNVTYMVLQYAENGTLFERIKETRMDKAVIRKLFREVCSAVGFLHQNGYMHRDIKPENILLTKKGQAKLCDFGFAAETEAPRRTICGTYQYMSPEMILKEPYTNKNDIWSLGILLFQMIQGSAPFRGQSMEEVFKSMKQQIYFSERFTKLEISFIRDILKVNPKNRPEVSEMLNHPYFADDTNSIGKLTKSTNSSEEEALIASMNKIKIGTTKNTKSNDMSLQEPPRVDRDPERPPMSHPISSQAQLGGYAQQPYNNIVNPQYCPPPPHFQYYQPQGVGHFNQASLNYLPGPMGSPHQPPTEPSSGKNKISLKR